MSVTETKMVEQRTLKQQVHDNQSKKIKELRFGLASGYDTLDQSVVQISDRNVYELSGRTGTDRPVTEHGPNDKRLGVSTATGLCESCHRLARFCNGHFGYIKLTLPCFHVGFMKNITELLQCVCKICSALLLDEQTRRRFLKAVRKPQLESAAKKSVLKSILKDCKKRVDCPNCHQTNGVVKRVPGHALKIVHDRFQKFEKSKTANKEPPEDKVWHDRSFESAKKKNPDLEKHIKKALEDLSPLKALSIFRNISDDDSEVLGMIPPSSRPEMLIWRYVPVPPVTIRPSVAQDSATTEDDITNKIGDIVSINETLRTSIERGAPIHTVVEQWDYLQIQVAMLINSEVPNLQKDAPAKPIRGLCQRLKGKQGRFRGNLSGKRVDFSARTVISPDPNLSIDEVAVPERVAVTLTFPERVTPANIEKLRERIRNGKTYPGANVVYRTNGLKISIESLAKLNPGRLPAVAEQLVVGDLVDRHLQDGDIVLFNRQPSLHKLSIMGHRVKVRQWRTFRLNECVCTPYNADFDGDEMNLHVPQTEEARAEALELMSVKHNLATPKDGTPIIAATQDFLLTAYLLTSKDRFFDRQAFSQICSFMLNADGVFDPTNGDHSFRQSIELPEPAILKPEALWTGKQIFNVLMKPSRESKVLINFEGPCKEYKADSDQSGAPYLNENDAWLCVQNSEIMSGMLDKSTLGAGKKDSIFYVMMRDYGPDCAVEGMNRLSRLSGRWLSNEGFSVGINDVYPGSALVRTKKELVRDAYLRADGLIQDLKDGILKQDAGCDQAQTMENKITGILNDVRNKAGQACLAELSRWNSIILMAQSGAKGSYTNVSQMVSAVGQQIINNARVEDGFQDRTLPHFPKMARQPPSKGFVSNSFFSGLNPPEFLFHAMSGREGLVDTAVKTAETGYMSRRLMKSLEDLSAQYDTTVRNSAAGVVQFLFGEDGRDPVDMEANAKPVNFKRTFAHAQASSWSNSDKALLPSEIVAIISKRLQEQKEFYPRRSLHGHLMDFNDTSIHGIDQDESNRRFLRDVERFLYEKVKNTIHAREHVGLGESRMISDDDETKKLEQLADGVSKISKKAIDEFFNLCLSKYERSKVQPGHAVGAISAQSIGEPGTQMTLKTFHFAGVAGMSMTQGVPRIKEIINGSKNISTPIITCDLFNKTDVVAARAVQGRIEKTYLRDIIDWIEQTWSPTSSTLRIQISKQTIDELHLDISMKEIMSALVKAKGLHISRSCITQRGQWTLRIVLESYSTNLRAAAATAKRSPPTSTREKSLETFYRLQKLQRLLPDVCVKGYPLANRAVISRMPVPKGSTPPTNGDAPVEQNQLLVEGYGFKSCMTTSGVNGTKTFTNNINELYSVLGIEAARAGIIRELDLVMGSQMNIDPRHMQLLADLMTFKGGIAGITRFGMTKMRDSVLQLASFEKTQDHLFEAAAMGKVDPIEGVSESVIMGKGVGLGTGCMKWLWPIHLEKGDTGRKGVAFEEVWRDHGNDGNGDEPMDWDWTE